MTRDKVYTIDETASLYSVSAKTIEREIADGRIEVHKIGRKRHISHEALLRYEWWLRDKEIPYDPHIDHERRSDVKPFDAATNIMRSLLNVSPSGGYVYFIKTHCETKIKIGWTGQDPVRRLGKLQTGNPEPIKLVAVCFGSKPLERQLHYVFDYLRYRGEWFHYKSELRRFVESIARDIR